MRPRRGAALALGLVLLTGCASAASEPPRAGPATSASPGRSAPPAAAPVPTATPDGAEATDRRAADLVAAMTTEQRAGQVIVARYSGLAPPVAMVGDLQLGGVILMGDNVGTPAEVRAATRALQAASNALGRPYPLLVGIDQEGGRVARVRAPATEFPTFMTLGAADDAQLTAEVARASGEELRSLGVTAVFAPVADVTSGPDDPTIGSRSPSGDPQRAARTVAASLAGYAAGGVAAAAKHFPGHGHVTADSHVELPVQPAPLAELAGRDLVPFEAAVRAGAPMIMVGHLDVRAVEAGTPSSLSPGTVTGLLRQRLGYRGVVVTDALDMAAVTGTAGPGKVAVAALAAGADLLLMPTDPRAARAAIVAAVAGGGLPADRLAEAATRVVDLQLSTAASPAAGSASVPDPLGSHEELSYRASLAGLTVVQGACAGPLVGPAVRVAGGEAADRARFTEAARAAGLTVGSGPLVRLLGSPATGGSGDVVVSLDAPYGLARSSATTARLALFGRTGGAFRALVDVLTGRAPAGGTLPVEVPGLPGSAC